MLGSAYIQYTRQQICRYFCTHTKHIGGGRVGVARIMAQFNSADKNRLFVHFGRALRTNAPHDEHPNREPLSLFATRAAPDWHTTIATEQNGTTEHVLLPPFIVPMLRMCIRRRGIKSR